MNFEQISKDLYAHSSFSSKVGSIEILSDLFDSHFDIAFIHFSKNILQSFIHTSFKNENNFDLGDNEKLEFLGDSVLQVIISERLFKTYPAKKEGELSKIRSALVNEASLEELALLLKLNKWILLGKGEIKSQGYMKPSILANTFEALLGAIYLDSSFQGAEKFMDYCLALFFKEKGRAFLSDSVLLSFDAKTKLQELVMKKYKTLPKYICEDCSADGSKESFFKVELVINNEQVCSTTHHSKKKAMEILASQALDKITS